MNSQSWRRHWLYGDVLGVRLVGVTSADVHGGSWLFYLVVTSLLVILGLSIVVMVLWKRIDSRHDCAMSRLEMGKSPLSGFSSVQVIVKFVKRGLGCVRFFHKLGFYFGLGSVLFQSHCHCAMFRLLSSIPSRLCRGRKHAANSRRQTNTSTALEEHSRLQ